MAKRTRSDIPFGQDPASRLLPLIVAVMVFIAALAVAGGFLLSNFADRWESGLQGAVTIQIPAPSDEAISPDVQDAAAERVLDVVRGRTGIRRAERMPTVEMRRLLEPWLGQAMDPRDLPLPVLITVELDDGFSLAQIDLPDLRRRVEAVAPGAIVDDHGEWQARLVAFLRSLRLVALTLVGTVSFAGLLVVVFATRSGLLAHRRTIELLHQFGAYDGYIARQFQYQAMMAGLKGGIVGWLAAVGTIILLAEGAQSTGAQLPGVAILGILEWLAVAALPIISALVSMVAARMTVMRALSRII
ncbi:MAG: cell division protein [Alphaproteobacteria bacterium]